MDRSELKTLLYSLIAQWENETVEFKEVGDNYSTSDIGKYFSALSNEANLRGVEKAWLIFGVNNQSRKVTTTDFRKDPDRLQATKKQIADGTEPSISFRQIHEYFSPDGGRVILFEIPAAPRGMPISWQSHYYARAGESLTGLALDKQDEIRQQTLASDWTAKIIPDANLGDLDESALLRARDSFALKNANRFQAGEIANWSMTRFLDRAKLTQDGKITRAALLLLGKSESTYKLSPHPAQITWKLEGLERAYEHFSPPFLLTTTKLYNNIRNIQLRILPTGELLPYEISKYDQKIVLEALHNCIAHQDYARNGRINVIEMPERLIFENEGGFFEGSPEDYALGEKMPRRYRNSFLVEAMVALNMIDKMGFGIHDMNERQAKRYFPLPDYDLSDPNSVRMTIYGGFVDPAYSQMLMKETNLAFTDILALDRVQKKLPIADAIVTRLRRSGLIEGRKPHFHVSSAIAAATATKAKYIRTRAQHDLHYETLILDYLRKNGSASRKELVDLLWPLLSEALDEDQKKHKISNLSTKLRRSGKIQNYGSDKTPNWRIKNAE